MILSIKNGRCIFNKTRFNFFYVTMKRVPIVTNFKRLIQSIKHLIKLILYENDVKRLKFKRINFFARMVF